MLTRPIYVGSIGEHLVALDAAEAASGRSTLASSSTRRIVCFDCVGRLVAARERVPYLDDKGFFFTETSLSSDFQRRSTQSVSVHLLLR